MTSLNLLELVWKSLKTVIFLGLNTFWESHPHVFLLRVTFTQPVKIEAIFPPKKIKTGFRPENLLCFARFAITQFVRLDGRVLHAIFCYIIEGLKEKDENSHVQGTAKHLCFYELWETQFYKNFYYWMFCLIKSNKTVQKWLAPQAHNAMRFSISHKTCPASELP